MSDEIESKLNPDFKAFFATLRSTNNVLNEIEHLLNKGVIFYGYSTKYKEIRVLKPANVNFYALQALDRGMWYSVWTNYDFNKFWVKIGEHQVIDLGRLPK